MYIVTFHILHPIINLANFIFVKTRETSEETSEGIEGELSSPDGIAKRLFGDNSKHSRRFELRLLKLLMSHTTSVRKMQIIQQVIAYGMVRSTNEKIKS